MLPLFALRKKGKEARRLTLFEKVILVNTLLLIGEALAGLWITSHSLETHHYLIDTSFIVVAALLSLLINFVLLHVSFRCSRRARWRCSSWWPRAIPTRKSPTA